MRADRLLKLADFLETRVPTKAFDFERIFQMGEKAPLEALDAGGGCGTIGCAIGWMPAAFPRTLAWRKGKYGAMDIVFKEDVKNDDSLIDFGVAGEFFDLPGQEVDYLFSPEGYLYDREYEVDLFRHKVKGNARPATVARHIRRFVEQKKSGEWDRRVERAMKRKLVSA